MPRTKTLMMLASYTKTLIDACKASGFAFFVESEVSDE
jgi:hypothetical protein